jgi:hypothetical protein
VKEGEVVGRWRARELGGMDEGMEVRVRVSVEMLRD